MARYRESLRNRKTCRPIATHTPFYSVELLQVEYTKFVFPSLCFHGEIMFNKHLIRQRQRFQIRSTLRSYRLAMVLEHGVDTTIFVLGFP